MAEKAKSLIDTMKERINKSGGSMKGIFYVRKEGSVRVRFLTEMNEGIELKFHSKWKAYNHLCLAHLGKDCPHCDEEEDGGNMYSTYAFTVWNYETKKREIFMYKATKNSPIYQLIALFEEIGTICDRDIVIKRYGEGVDTKYTATALDRKKFKGDEGPFSKKFIIKTLAKAFPYEGPDADEDEDEDDEEEEQPKKKAKKSKDDDNDNVPFNTNRKPKKGKKYEEEDEDEDEDDYDEDEDEEEDEDYDDEDDEEEEAPPKRKKKKR